VFAGILCKLLLDGTCDAFKKKVMHLS